MQDLALKIAQAAAAKRGDNNKPTLDLAANARKAAIRKLMAALKADDDDAFESAYSELSDIGTERDGD